MKRGESEKGMMPDLATFNGAQQFLAAIGARLSGSRARGDWHEESDWDYYLSQRGITRLHKALDRQGVGWDSPFVGCITWWPDGVQVETSFLFPRRSPWRS